MDNIVTPAPEISEKSIMNEWDGPVCTGDALDKLISSIEEQQSPDKPYLHKVSTKANAVGCMVGILMYGAIFWNSKALHWFYGDRLPDELAYTNHVLKRHDEKRVENSVLAIISTALGVWGIMRENSWNIDKLSLDDELSSNNKADRATISVLSRLFICGGVTQGVATLF